MGNLGGITLKEVIVFQTQLMMGAQFGRITKMDASQDDLIIACLRMGWNDAFRHTSENTKEGEHSILELEEKEWRKNHKEEYDDFICGKILNEPVVLDTYKKFVTQKTTAGKIQIIENKWNDLKKLFRVYKTISGDKQLCFGHFQKMFNIATKLYVCLYVCKQELGICADKFDSEIIKNIQYADCPIDSIILKKLSEQTNTNYNNQKWSKYGTANHKTENYKEIQETISSLDVTDKKSKLYYDFIAWKQA